MQNEESLEVVLETIDPTEVAIIKSLLEALVLRISTTHFAGHFVGRYSVPLGDL